jgi:hypothetical protein
MQPVRSESESRGKAKGVYQVVVVDFVDEQTLFFLVVVVVAVVERKRERFKLR